MAKIQQQRIARGNRVKYDVEGVIHEYWRRGANSERAELVEEFRNAVVQGGNMFKNFLAEVTEEAYRQSLPPVNAMALAMMYGMAIGVLAEKERVEREKKLIV